MIVIGAGGFAIELLEILVSKKYGYAKDNLFFFDNVTSDLPNKLFNEFTILKSLEEVEEIFKSDSNDFCLGIGNPKLREKLNISFENIGGELMSIISEKSEIGSFETEIREGCSLMTGSNISNNVKIGKGCLIYGNSFIAHDVIIKDYVEISPGVNITGNCKIGKFTSIGAGTTIIPNITIGENVVIGAGSVIIQDVGDDCTVVGVPGKIVVPN